MHDANMIFWKYIRRIYANYFNENILEVGSHDVNGNIKSLFDNAKEYIGVDWRGGPNVDVVTFAHNMDFPTKFKAVISSSLLEHDPYWKKSIPKMIEYVRYDGILVMSWGASRNPPHCHDHSPDGKFHPLKGDLVKSILQEAGYYITIWIYEKNLYKIIGEPEWEYLLKLRPHDPKIKYIPAIKYAPFPNRMYASNDGWGELAIVAFPHDKESIIHIDESLCEDQV